MVPAVATVAAPVTRMNETDKTNDSCKRNLYGQEAECTEESSITENVDQFPKEN